MDKPGISKLIQVQLCLLIIQNNRGTLTKNIPSASASHWLFDFRINDSSLLDPTFGFPIRGVVDCNFGKVPKLMQTARRLFSQINVDLVRVVGFQQQCVDVRFGITLLEFQWNLWSSV